MKEYNISVYLYTPNEYKHIPSDLWIAYSRIDHTGKSYRGTYKVSATTLAKAKTSAIKQAKAEYLTLGY